jgi:hypothetical protein
MTIDNPASNPVLNHGAGRVLWVDYLRSFMTVLVVAHHSTLAYTTFARFNPHAYIVSTHPIIDNKRWTGLDIFENFNDYYPGQRPLGFSYPECLLLIFGSLYFCFMVSV